MSLSGSWVRLGFTMPGKSSLVVISLMWVLNHHHLGLEPSVLCVLLYFHQISTLSLVVKHLNGSAHHKYSTGQRDQLFIISHY